MEEYVEKKQALRQSVLTAIVSVIVTFVLTVGFVVYIGVLFIPKFISLSNTIGEPPNLGIISSKENEKSAQKLKDIVELIKNEYYIELSDEEILEAMGKGLPTVLESPYTYYLTADQYEEIEESMSGQYVGIGCTVTLNEERQTEVVEVYPDSPAAKTGLRSGDIIIKVDDADVREAKDVNEVAAKVKGEEGSTVKISVYRKSEDKIIEMDMIRSKIDIVTLKYRMIDGDVGYVHIKGFVGDVDKDFEAAMDDLQSKGAKNVIFDLRYNSGGSAAIMVNMLEYLLPEDMLLSTIKGRENGEEYTVERKTEKPASVPEDMKFAILLNEYSASASEFFSGALRDHDAAVLIGEKTFGKGSGTSTYVLEDGSAVNVTIFQYFLPGGECVEGVGITPDIIVQLPEEYKYNAIETVPEEEDTVLQRALEELGG